MFEPIRISRIAVATLSLGTVGLLSMAPVQAQSLFNQTEEPAPDQGGSSLMERGAELFFRGLREEMAPTFEGLQELLGDIGPSMGEFLAEMGPALADIASRVEDWSAYELPEMLPNGDIIIRKKQKDVPEGEGEGDIEI